MGDRKCPLDVRVRGSKDLHIKKFNYCTKCNFSFPNMLPHSNPKYHTNLTFMINIYQALLYYSGHSFIQGCFPLYIFSCTKQKKNFIKPLHVGV